MEGMTEMMIEQAKLADEMYEETGIEEDEFTAALLYHNIMNDPDVVKKQYDNMRKLGMGVPMGGMGMM